MAELIAREGDIEPVVVCGATRAEVVSVLPPGCQIHVIPAFEGISDFVAENRNLNAENVLDRLLTYSPAVAVDLHQHDYARLYDLEPEGDTPLRQLFLCRFAEDVLDSLKPSHVFITGGCDLLRNVFNQLARAHAIPAYRSINLEFLNRGMVGARIWFAPDESYRPPTAQRGFGYDDSAVRTHVREWIEGVRLKHHRLDGLARAEQSEKISCGIVGAIRDWNAVRKRDNNWHLAAYRLRSWSRRTMSSDITTRWDKVPQPFVTFALCGIMDWHINLRAGAIRDQLSICQQILNAMPLGVNLAIREHPGQPGALPAAALRQFLRDNRGRAYFMNGEAPLMSVLSRSRGLISINSTSLAEAAVFGFPAMNLGVGGYDWADLTYRVERIEDLGPQLAALLADTKRHGRALALENTLAAIIHHSTPAPGVYVDPADSAAVRQMLADAHAAIVRWERRFGRAA